MPRRPQGIALDHAPLRADWLMLQTAADAADCPAALEALADRTDWLPAPVPGTVAQALRAAGRWPDDATVPLHGHDHWYRCRVLGHGPHRLRLGGLATVAELWFDGRCLLRADNMFVEHELDLLLRGEHRLDLCFRSLDHALRQRRARGRWRPRLTDRPVLAALRTTLLGHMPGWCPPVQTVGPWRDLELLPAPNADAPLRHARCEVMAHLDGDDGVVVMTLRDVFPTPRDDPPLLVVDGRRAPLGPAGAGVWRGSLRLPAVRKWWPHTHGEPALYAVAVALAGVCRPCARVGFRTIDIDRGHGGAPTIDGEGQGFALRVNGVPIFCRGVCLSSLDLRGHAPDSDTCSRALASLRDANANMVRVSGVSCYQPDAFYRACDALGIMVWQDFMFANFDYEASAARDPRWLGSVRDEIGQWLAGHAHHAAVAVLCGGSEAEQQAAMLGAGRQAWRQPLFDTVIADCIAAHRAPVAYVRNSPSGGAWPFAPEHGVSHYYGVGAYQRPLHDARLANVRFAAECLAFANVPCDRTLREAGLHAAVHDPRWKAAVPRDAGSNWDFDDVRDFYLRTLYRVDPARLRYEDMARYLQLSRAVVAELMAGVFGEWRRAGSACAGGLVWQWQDLWPGAGWGIVDARGRPKSGWHALAGVWRPLQLLMTDEGLNGVHLHLINESTRPRRLNLRLRCLRDGLTPVLDVACPVTLAPRTTRSMAAAQLADTFFDFTYAYRFGPRAHDVVWAELSDPADGAVVDQAFLLPDPSAAALEPPELQASVAQREGQWWLTVTTRRFARWVEIADDVFEPACNWFHVPPGGSRTVLLRADPRQDELDRPHADAIPMGEVRAVNARRPVAYRGWHAATTAAAPMSPRRE